MEIPQPLRANCSSIWSPSWYNIIKRKKKKGKIFPCYIWLPFPMFQFMCAASHHLAVNLWKESGSIYSVSSVFSVVMGFPLVAKAGLYIWTKAQFVDKLWAIFHWRPFWRSTSQIPSFMFWRRGLICGWFSIPVTADALLSINIQKFHSIIFLSAFHLAALLFCVLKLLIWQVRFRHLPSVVHKPAD